MPRVEMARPCRALLARARLPTDGGKACASGSEAGERRCRSAHRKSARRRDRWGGGGEELGRRLLEWQLQLQLLLLLLLHVAATPAFGGCVCLCLLRRRLDAVLRLLAGPWTEALVVMLLALVFVDILGGVAQCRCGGCEGTCSFRLAIV